MLLLDLVKYNLSQTQSTEESDTYHSDIVYANHDY